jgi:group I intron endonuclease
MGGIYRIRNLVNGKFYIGSAVNLHRRWLNHLSTLRHSTHANSYLQHAWNKYGSSSFIFEVVERVDNQDYLLLREQEWLDRTRCYRRSIGYNLCKRAGNTAGRLVSEKTRIKQRTKMRGRHLSEVHRQKIGESLRVVRGSVASRRIMAARVSGIRNPMFGKSHSLETKALCSQAGKRSTHKRYHLARGIVKPNCELCQLFKT